MPKQPVVLDNPEQSLLAHFWICLRDDLSGRACTSDNLPARYRRLPYSKRVIIEREQLKRDALAFLDTDEFEVWAEASGLKPTLLREMLLEVANGNS